MSGRLAWVLVVAAAWLALPAVSYRARDPDSRLHAEISARMSEAGAPGWIAPEFPPGWYMSGLYREHPAGIFLPAAGLAALGYPAAQAAYAANAVYQVLGIVTLQRLAATLVPGLESRALGWLIQLLPIAFTFRIRANHEAALLLCLLAALYGAERARREPRFVPLIALGLVGLLLVKGLLSLFGPLLCAAWLVARRLAAEADPPRSDRAAWLGVVAGVAAMAVAAAVYELLYRLATEQPFWPFYAARQLGVAAAAGEGSGLLDKLYNLVWYLGRVLWFPFPWSVVLAGVLASWIGRRGWRTESATRPEPGVLAGALFTGALVALYLAAFSLSDRRADRYIFPVYYAVAAAGAVAALRRWPRLRRLVARADRPWLPAAVFGATFLAHLLAGRLGLPTVKLWAP